MATRTRCLIALAAGSLLLALSQIGHAGDIVFACKNRGTALELASLSNEYHLHVLEVGRVTMAERYGHDDLQRQVEHRTELARRSGVCAFVPAFPHRYVAMLSEGTGSLIAAGLAGQVHEVVALDGGKTFYLIGMEQRPAQP